MTFFLLEVYLCGWLQKQRIPTPRSLQELTMPLSHLVFQYALLKLFGGVQGLGGDKLLSHYPLVWPCNKPFSAPNSSLFGLTVHQAQGLALDNSLFLFPLTVNIFLMATMTILWSEPW